MKQNNTKFSTCTPNFSAYILYLFLLTIRLGFTLDIKISTFYDFYFAQSNFLCFIPIPSNRSPICIGFTLDIKFKKLYKVQCCPFLMFLKVANFLLSFFPSQFYLIFFFYCCVENLLSKYSPPIMQSSFSSVSLVVHKCILWHWGMLQECALVSYRVLHSNSLNI